MFERKSNFVWKSSRCSFTFVPDMAKKSLKLPCALKNGKVITIEKAKSGEKGYTCPGCNDDVIVRKGAKRRAHFAHKSGAICETGYQTAIHLLAKDIILREQRFRIPDLSGKYARDGYHTVLVSNRKVVLSLPLAKTLDLSDATITTEKRLFDKIPDIVISYEKIDLVVEIFVTHKVTDEKIAVFQKQKTSIIEIDLSKQRMLSEDELKFLLCDSTEHKSWLFNRKLAWVSRTINLWEQGSIVNKYIIYTQKELFKNQELIDASIVFKPLTEIHNYPTRIAECPKKNHYSKDAFFATLDECISCPFYIASFESAYSNAYSLSFGKGILCQTQESYQKHSLNDFALWLQEYAREEARNQRCNKNGLNLDRWTYLLSEKAKSFIPDLVDLSEYGEFNFIVRSISSQSYIDYFFL